MQPASQVAPVSRTSLWAGRVLSALVLLLIVFGAMFGVLKPDVAKQGFAHYGYPDGAMLRITIIEIACAILYAIPRTSVLGAILLTGYLGGATSTHVRVGEPFFLPVIVGIVLWLGLYLRDHRVRALVPFRSGKNPLTNP
jgi:DoxX-like family